jgi:DNA-binding transcriptional LysR family regulator
MELRQLEHFVAVAEDESFTRAARRLGYVQSALSVSIQSIERELSVRLFDRTTHRVRLTDAGHALLPSARATISGAQAFRDEAAALNGVLTGTLRIGIMQAFAAINVPHLLGHFHREHPRVDITMRPAAGGSAELLASVAQGELDLGFVAVIDLPRGLRSLPLANEGLMLVSGGSAAPDATGPVRLRDLAEASFIDFPSGWGVRTIVDRAFAKLGVHRRVAIEVADVATLIQLVREGLGVSLLPLSLVGVPTDGIQTRETRPALSWDLALVTRAEGSPNPAAAAFIALLES